MNSNLNTSRTDRTKSTSFKSPSRKRTLISRFYSQKSITWTSKLRLTLTELKIINNKWLIYVANGKKSTMKRSNMMTSAYARHVDKIYHKNKLKKQGKNTNKSLTN